ncbi:Heavy-metal resistance protein CzcE [Collimonas sp. OK607]|uniref:CzcE family metal-binding protein n=1 Tax=Collimonas sp. OK607 TaxID=1798194 RepID=UPI0008ED2D62|nr:CzcE family metal-binding protein [Collimonas sp. OK607]SFA71883.1 Heavy-metal resistance protein CzcE [Collimonas sp. OK607]
MSSKFLIPTLLALALSVSAASSMAASNHSLLGETAAPAATSRVITITPDTKYVNVQGGQAVQFNAGGGTFSWSFNGPAKSFELNRVAPSGLLDHPVTVYVSPNPLYNG